MCPEKLKPLSFVGSLRNGRWDSGFLWAEEEAHMYPVINGIPVFVPPWRSGWSEDALRRIRQDAIIAKNWNRERQRLDEEPKLRQFAERIVQSDGLILDIASGPGGGFVPMVLRLNAETKILMSDLSFGLLQEWQNLIRGEGMTCTSFAAFDATKMPIESNSIDIVQDIGGFDNVQESFQAIREAHRVLRPNAVLFSVNSLLEPGEPSKIPSEISERWRERSPIVFEGYKKYFRQAGFKITSHALLTERELSPEEGDLSREAANYGVKIRIKHFCTELTK